MAIELPLQTMSTAEKLDALEAIWASLCDHPNELHSPDWHEAVLAARRRRLATGEASVSDWNEAKQRLRQLP